MQDGDTPLHVIAPCGEDSNYGPNVKFAESVSELIVAGADLFAKNKVGVFPPSSTT